MRRQIGIIAGFMIVSLAQLPLKAQVITPMELSDPKVQHLQQKHVKDLMAIAGDINVHKFPYPFYFSRTLDLDLSKMQTADQRSIRFDVYKGETVLEITGNYYAAYSANLMDSYARLKETFIQVAMPLLQAAVPHFPDDSEFSSFAIEVSHHVRQQVMGVTSEQPENMTVIIPVTAAQRLVDAKSDSDRQAAILDARVYLNGEPYSLWLQEGNPTEEWKERTQPSSTKNTLKASTAQAEMAAPAPSVAKQLTSTSQSTLRLITPETLSKLQLQTEDTIDRMTKELDQQAHFVPYAEPAFVGFRHGAYLQLSISTKLNASEGSSRYKLAALAFDEHVSHLIRPLLTYFPPTAEFDGISFSSIVRYSDGSSPLAVEFFFPFPAMTCFAALDCTGQQLLDSGTIVINGERSAVNLQVAEGKN